MTLANELYSLGNKITSVLESVGGESLRWEESWTNSSPTSNFAAQTISITSGFPARFALIISRMYDTTERTQGDIIDLGLSEGYIDMAFSAGVQGPRNFSRTIQIGKIADNQYRLQINAGLSVYGSNVDATANNCMIPQAIYTLGGVIKKYLQKVKFLFSEIYRKEDLIYG